MANSGMREPYSRQDGAEMVIHNKCARQVTERFVRMVSCVSMELRVIGNLNREAISKFRHPRIDEVINMERYSAIRNSFIPVTS
jgi:hypothetical protein